MNPRTKIAQTVLMLSMVTLVACSQPSALAPMVESDTSPRLDTTTRAIIFRAEDADSPVSARCTILGPEISTSFDTPAMVDIPIDDTGRPLIDSIGCRFGGETAEWAGIPGPETRAVKAAFGGAGLFGKVSLIFGPSENSVQYYARRGDLVRVSGAPAP